MEAKRGDWVRIYDIVLEVGQRSANVPEDTKKVPLEMWVKGFLIDEKAQVGDTVKIETYIGRTVEGKLLEVNPFWEHDFGKSVPELLYIGRQARELLSKDVSNDE